jgi:MFS family permease
MTASSLAVALLFCCYLAVDRVWQLFALAALSGIVLSGFWPSLQAWLGRGKDRRQLLPSVGRFNVAWSLGFLVGPALGGMLYAVSPDRVFALAAALVGIVFLSVSLLPVQEEEPAGRGGDEAATLAAARRFLPVAWTANFATFFAVGSVRSLFPKLATDLGIAPGSLGWLMALIGLGQVLAFLLISRTDRWQFRLAPLAAIQLLNVAGLGSLIFGRSPELFAAGLLGQGALIGATFTASIFYSLHARGPGGRRTGIHEGIVGSGVFIGPLAGGLAAEHVGPRAPYLLAAAVLLAAVVFQAYLLRREGR